MNVNEYETLLGVLKGQAARYGVEVKHETEDHGIRVWSRTSKHAKWYGHGLFECGYNMTGTRELPVSFEMQYAGRVGRPLVKGAEEKGAR